MITHSDFSTVSYLVARGHKVVKKEKEGKRVIFYFDETQEIKDDFEELEWGDAIISATKLFDIQRKLKTQISLILRDD